MGGQGIAGAGGAGQEVQDIDAVMGGEGLAVPQAPRRMAGLPAADLGLTDTQGSRETGLGLTGEMHESSGSSSHTFTKRHLHDGILEDWLCVIGIRDGENA